MTQRCSQFLDSNDPGIRRSGRAAMPPLGFRARPAIANSLMLVAVFLLF